MSPLIARGEGPAGRFGRPHPSAMPLIGESIVPWLGATIVLALVNLTMILDGSRPPILEQSVLFVGLCGSLAAAGLVAARSSSELRSTRRSERARPPAEQLDGASAGFSSVAYRTGMSGWVAAMHELVDHAASASTPGAPIHAELTEAAAEMRDLRAVLDGVAADDLDIIKAAELHALGTLWETTQSRIEQLAAQVDPGWYRRWRARSVVARRLRHGQPAPGEMALPYSG
ncbi:MAG: hypothetical protein ACT452_17680 [Microthrixaceae bacterium]